MVIVISGLFLLSSYAATIDMTVLPKEYCINICVKHTLRTLYPKATESQFLGGASAAVAKGPRDNPIKETVEYCTKLFLNNKCCYINKKIIDGYANKYIMFSDDSFSGGYGICE